MSCLPYQKYTDSGGLVKGGMMGFSSSNYCQVQSPSCSFPVSVEGQCLGLPDVLERSVVGLVTLLKSLAIM